MLLKASWFSKQWHTVESSVLTIAELSERLRDVQKLYGSINQKNIKKDTNLQDLLKESCIDAVLLSHEFSDHTHKETLLELDPIIPVFATQRAADLVRSWHFFKQVFTIPTFSTQTPDWRETSIGSLPDWIGISRITTWADPLSFHSAVLVAFKIEDNVEATADSKGLAEAIIYSPHGINAIDLQSISRSRPPLKTLALLHGVDDIRIGSISRLNLGAHNGLKAQRICQAKYWVGTHDEAKEARGIVAPFLRRKTLTIQEAIEEEKRTNGSLPRSCGLLDMQHVRFEAVPSGQSLLLD